MNPSSENPLENQLKAELEDSQWLQKFKWLGEILNLVKTEIPLTQLCELKWNTTDESLVINCPNQEVWQALSQESAKFTELNQQIDRLVIRYGDLPDLIFANQNSRD